MTEVEYKNQIESWGDSAIEIEEEMSYFRENRDEFTTYRDEDVRRVFPEIDESDEFSYYCFVHLSYPQSHSFGYVSDILSEHEVRLKYLDCSLRDGGLACTLRIEKAYFSGNPLEYFSIDENIEIAQAIEIIELFRAKISNFTNLDSISRSGDGFLLHFGRQGCACRSELEVKLNMEAGEGVLEVSDTIAQRCA